MGEHDWRHAGLMDGRQERGHLKDAETQLMRAQAAFTHATVAEQKALARKRALPDVALSGLAGAGKDTAAAVLVEEYGYVVGKFAKPVYDAVLKLDPLLRHEGNGLRLADRVGRQGWEYVKRHHPEARRLLQVMGTDVGRDMFGQDFWVEQAARWRQGVDGPVVWTDTRFPNEVQFVTGDGPGQRRGFWVHIDRPGQAIEGEGHVSESSLPDTAEADYLLTNDGSVALLHSKVLCMMEGLRR